MPITLAVMAMATRFELVLDGLAEPTLRAAGEEAIAEIEMADQRLSLFRRDSLLAHLQRTAHLGPVRLDADVLGLFAVAKAVHEASGGAFDPTIGPLMRAWGLRGEPADESAARAAQACVGFDHVIIDPAAGTVRFTRPDLELDLGGIAKGFALDLATRSLRTHGVRSALLHGGTSSISAIGAPPNAPGWKIGLGDLGGSVTLNSASMSVSASRRWRAEHADSPPIHIIDPRAGRPVDARTAASRACVVVAHHDPWSATRAEAWSTAFIVSGGLPPGDTGPEGVAAWRVATNSGSARSGPPGESLFFR